MPVKHQHQRGSFDPGYCRDCARDSDLLDHYHHVQRQEQTLRQAHRWARQARHHAAWALGQPASGSCWPPSPCSPAEAAVLHDEERLVHYEIRVRGVLGSGWSAWFEGLRVTSDAHGQTVIAGPVADQAALHGLLTKVRDLGLELLSVRRIDPD